MQINIKLSLYTSRFLLILIFQGAAKEAPIITPLMDFIRQKRAAKGGPRVRSILLQYPVYFVNLLDLIVMNNWNRRVTVELDRKISSFFCQRHLNDLKRSTDTRDIFLQFVATSMSFTFLYRVIMGIVIVTKKLIVSHVWILIAYARGPCPMGKCREGLVVHPLQVQALLHWSVVLKGGGLQRPWYLSLYIQC